MSGARQRDAVHFRQDPNKGNILESCVNHQSKPSKTAEINKVTSVYKYHQIFALRAITLKLWHRSCQHEVIDAVTPGWLFNAVVTY